MGRRRDNLAGMAHFDGYVRVSQVRGREGAGFISPAVQEEQIRRWADYHDADISQVFTDLDKSGGTIDRPGFQQALERIETGQSQGIVVAKLDRFARSIHGAYEAIQRIDKAGGRFVSVADNFDLSTSQGRLMFNIMASFAQFELDRTRDNWLIARQRAVERGVHIASRTPTGYMRRNDGTLEPHPNDSRVIRKVFELRAAGGSWKAITDLLNREGVVGPYKAAQWTQRAACHIIENPVYLGEARSGSFTNAEAHEPLVTRDLFDAAQNARPEPASRTVDQMDPPLLTGLLRCAGCRHLLKPDKMTDRHDERIRIYRCRGKHSSGNCQARVAVLASVIEPWVEAEALRVLADRQATATESTAELGEALSALREAEGDLAAYRDNPKLIALLGEDRFIEGLEPRIAAVDFAQDAVDSLRARLTPVDIPGEIAPDELWASLDISDRRRLLHAMYDCVFLRSAGQANVPIADRALIFSRGDGPSNLPRRGHRVPLASLPWPDRPDGPGVASGEDVREDTVEV